MQKTWQEQNCMLTLDFVVASPCHTTQEHRKDATGHVFSMASERQPEVWLFFFSPPDRFWS